jgi:hypothetical protein
VINWSSILLLIVLFNHCKMEVVVCYHGQSWKVSFQRPVLYPYGDCLTTYGQQQCKTYTVSKLSVHTSQTSTLVHTFGDLAIKSISTAMMAGPWAGSDISGTFGCNIIGLWCCSTQCCHYANEYIPFKPMKLFCSPISTRYCLMLSGPINNLSDELTVQVIMSFGRFDMASINALIRINKRYRRLFSTDSVWNNLVFPTFPWNVGLGWQGNEGRFWHTLQVDLGLSCMVVAR